MIQQPRAPCGQADADVCQHCAGDCPASGHEKTCRGGCSRCTCGGHDPLDVDAFKAFLDRRNIANSRKLIACVRWCCLHGVTTPDAIDDGFPELAATTRSRYRNAMRQFEDFLGASV